MSSCWRMSFMISPPSFRPPTMPLALELGSCVRAATELLTSVTRRTKAVVGSTLMTLPARPRQVMTAISSRIPSVLPLSMITVSISPVASVPRTRTGSSCRFGLVLLNPSSWRRSWFSCSNSCMRTISKLRRSISSFCSSVVRRMVPMLSRVCQNSATPPAALEAKNDRGASAWLPAPVKRSPAAGWTMKKSATTTARALTHHGIGFRSKKCTSPPSGGLSASRAPAVLDVHQHLPEHVQVLQHHSGSAHYCLERILSDVDRDACSLCLLYTSDAADDLLCVDLGGRRIIK